MSHSASEDPLLTFMQGADAEYARRVRRGGVASFLAFAMQNRSYSAREVLVRAASDGVLGLTEFEVMMRSLAGEAPVTRSLALDVVRGMNARLLLALAGLTANQRLSPDDVPQARTLYSLILEAHDRSVFTRTDRKLFLELLSDEGRYHEFEATFPRLRLGDEDWRQAMLLMANLVNPWVPSNQFGDLTLWNRLVSSVFVNDGIEPFEVAPTVGHAFDNILCSSPTDAEFGPKVSVLVPTFNPGPRLGTAIASLLNQTWPNLEILILDDGSEREHRYYMDAWAERDTRIRVFHLRGNNGNYAARNIGLENADGELVTVHDDDDWSHPRKLETQARALVDAPDTVSNMSQLVRATDTLRFTRINDNPDFIQKNYSSLMFRRDEVVDGLGYWNETNRAADAEFRDRLTKWSGSPPPVIGAAPLSLLRVREGSLTSGEIHRGYLDPRRRWYGLSAEGWRADTTTTGGRLYMSRDNDEPKFSVPVSMSGAGSREQIHVDVIYATDYRFPGGNTSVATNEIRALLDEGNTIGILQMDSPVLGSTRHLSKKIRDLSLHPRCKVVTLLDDVICDVLIVRHPTVVQYTERRRSRVVARRAVLIVNHAPALRDGSEAHYDLSTCLENFQWVFGKPPLVAPESGVIRECLQGLVDQEHMASFDWHGVLSMAVGSPRRVEPHRAPVIGRHSRDNSEKWPTESADLEAAYPIDGSYDVRVLGGADVPLRRLAHRVVRGWTVYPFGSMPPRQFLEQVDFWVYFHSEHLIESFGMAAAEAMASGAVVILPPYLRSTFGPGAIYCKPDEVQGVVADVWSDEEEYTRQSARGIDVVLQRFTVETFLGRIAELRQS